MPRLPRLPSPLVFLMLLAGAAVTSAAAAESTTVAGDDPRVQVIGRTVVTNEGLTMAYPGVSLKFRYSGAAPTLHFDASNADNSFNLSCNGWDPVVIRLPAGASSLALPTGRAPASGWEIVLVRRNESWMGTVTFTGLTVPADGTLLEPPPLPARRLLVLGDSAACGEFIERFPPEDNASHPQTINAGRAFGMLLGRWLDAQVHLVTYGGRGVVTDWAGRTATNNAPQFYPLALPDDPESRWDATRFAPDVILTHLGMCDYLSNVDGPANYAAAWHDLLDQVRHDHPDVPIVLAEAAGLSDQAGTERHTMRQNLRAVLDAVTEARRKRGEDVRVAPLSYYPGTPADPHPVAFQHEQIALELMPVVQAAAGW